MRRLKQCVELHFLMKSQSAKWPINFEEKYFYAKLADKWPIDFGYVELYVNAKLGGKWTTDVCQIVF